MPFCSQCGKEMEEMGRFCPSCGAAVTAAPMPAAASPAPNAARSGAVAVGSDAAARTGGKVAAGVLNAALVLCAFMPWVNVDLYLWSGEFSIPGLLQLSSELQGYASAIGGSAYSDSGEAAVFAFVSFAVLIAWLAVLGLLIRDGYRYFTGKKGFSSAGAGAMCCLSALSLLVLFAADQLLASNLGTSSGVITATLWLWLSIGLSIATLIYIGAKEGEARSAEGMRG